MPSVKAGKGEPGRVVFEVNCKTRRAATRPTTSSPTRRSWRSASCPRAQEMGAPPNAASAPSERRQQRGGAINQTAAGRRPRTTRAWPRPPPTTAPATTSTTTAVKAVVLVGGEGTRLRPLTYRPPSRCCPIANQPFLERQLAWMARARRRRGRAVARLPARRVRRGTSPTAASATCSCATPSRPEPLGTAGAIRFAADVAGIDERFVVCNGDVLTALDLGALVAFHDARGAQATIHLVPVSRPVGVRCRAHLRRRRGEGVRREAAAGPGAVTNWINAGTYVLEPSVLDRIPPRHQRVDRARDVPADARPARSALRDRTATCYWLDIGTPEQVPRGPRRRRCAARSVCRRWPGAEEREPGIWVEPGAVIDAVDPARAAGARRARHRAVGPGCLCLAATSVGAGAPSATARGSTARCCIDGAAVGRAAEVVDCVLGTERRDRRGGHGARTRSSFAPSHRSRTTDGVVV